MRLQISREKMRAQRSDCCHAPSSSTSSGKTGMTRPMPNDGQHQSMVVSSIDIVISSASLRFRSCRARLSLSCSNLKTRYIKPQRPKSSLSRTPLSKRISFCAFLWCLGFATESIKRWRISMATRCVASTPYGIKSCP